MSPSRITAVILAGGQGTRIRHLLPDLPKPMAPVLGRPFLEWIIRFLIQQSFTRIIISTGYKADIIAAHCGALIFPGAEIICVSEERPLGTAGGFLRVVATQDKPPEAWLVCNGDSLVLTSLSVLWSGHLEEKGALLGVRVKDASAYGTLRHRADHVLEGFAEKTGGAGLINAGVYFLRNELVRQFPSHRPLSFEFDVFPYLISIGITLRAVPTAVPFLDIGTPNTLAKAEDFIRTNHVFFGSSR